MGILGGGAILSGGDMAPELQQKVNGLISQFEESVSEIANAKGLRRAVVRSQLDCNSIILLDRSHLLIIAEQARGMAKVFYFDRPENEIGANEAASIGVWEFGFQDPFVIGLPRPLLDLGVEQRAPLVNQAASQWVEAEERRVVAMTQLVQME